MCNWIVNPNLARLEIPILKQKRKWQTRLFTLRNFLLCTWILMHVLDRLQKIKRYFDIIVVHRNTKRTEKTKKLVCMELYNQEKMKQSMECNIFSFVNHYMANTAIYEQRQFWLRGHIRQILSFTKKKLPFYRSDTPHSVSWIEDAMREI